jgi:hypothetical protein
MRRLTAAAALAGLLALPAPAQEKTYEIKLKKEAKGDRVKVATTDAGDMTFLLEVMGQEMKKGEKKTVKLAYTEEVLARPAGAAKPTKLTRTYQTAQRVKDGGKKVFVYQGKTVLIEKKGDKYVFTVDGQPLDEEDAEELEEEFNKKDDIPLENEDLMPNKPVRLNETWTVDAGQVVKAFESGGPLTLVKDKTTVTGKLTKVYDKGGRRFGVIELNLDLGVKELKLDDQELATKPGSRVTAKITLDACIDGTAHTGTETGTVTFDLKGDIPNGSLAVTGTAKYDRTAEDLGAK